MTGWRVAAVAVGVELVGVLSVGALSYLATDLFPDKTVWSHFGQGYGYLPLVLPFAGLAWLRHTRRAARCARTSNGGVLGSPCLKGRK